MLDNFWKSVLGKATGYEEAFKFIESVAQSISGQVKAASKANSVGALCGG